MFKKILFATDASPVCDIAAQTAFELSKKYGSELILIYVDEDSPQGQCPFIQDGLAGKMKRSSPEYMAAVKMGMELHYDGLARKFTTPDYNVIKGKSSREILEFAKENSVDCIIVGTHAGNKSTGGKTLQGILKDARCPVMSIARSCETSFWYFNQIIFGTDFSDASMTAFQFAFRLADYIGCKLHIFHALEIESSKTSATPDQKQIEDQIKEAETRIKDLYVSQMGKFDNYDLAVREGIAYVELLKFARETKGDLIVVSPHAKKNKSGIICLSPTIKQVLYRSACPVMSVRPSCPEVNNNLLY